MTDLELVASHIYQTGNLPTPEVDEAWMRICAKVNNRGTAGVVAYIEAHGTATPTALVKAGVCHTRQSAQVRLADLYRRKAIRRVAYGTYALANP